MPSHPDADLFPHATGAAAKTVAAHSSDEDLKLYAGWFCPFVQRAWLTLEELQIPYTYIEVNPYNKPDSLLSLNPRGLIPTLSVPTSTTPRPLYESNIITEYINETHVDATRPAGERKGSWEGLFPKDRYKKAYGKIWIDHVTTRIIPAFHRFLQHDGSTGTDLETARKEFHGTLKTWIEAADSIDGEDSDGPWFFGSQFSLVDIALAPWAVRLWVFDHFKEPGGLGLPGKDDEDPAWKRFHVWLDAVEARESIVKTTSEKEKYVPIYARYATNTAQSELAKATREGRGVP